MPGKRKRELFVLYVDEHDLMQAKLDLPRVLDGAFKSEAHMRAVVSVIRTAQPFLEQIASGIADVVPPEGAPS